MLNSVLVKRLSFFTILLVFWCYSETAMSDDTVKEEIPTRYGMAGVFGKTFDPVDDIHFIEASGFVMWDYDKVWRHWAPDPLRFKVEGTVGTTVSPNSRIIVSTGMMALYYLDFMSTGRLTPYIEGGIGLIYTDFQVAGQGSRVNFHPQIGIGTEFKPDSGEPYFAAIRLSHLSNGGLHRDNRGVNSVVLVIGRFFSLEF